MKGNFDTEAASITQVRPDWRWALCITQPNQGWRVMEAEGSSATLNLGLTLPILECTTCQVLRVTAHLHAASTSASDSQSIFGHVMTLIFDYIFGKTKSIKFES